MKTSLAKHLYVFNVLDLMLEESKFQNLKYKCIWFGLEESLEEFQCSVLQYALSKYYEVYVTQDELLSRINPLRDEVERLIESEKVKNYYQRNEVYRNLLKKINKLGIVEFDINNFRMFIEHDKKIID